MRNAIFNGLVYGLVCVSLGLMVSACNTTKATMDSIVKFSSSTSPESLFTADGLVEQSQKANLYAAVNTLHLSVLLNVPPGKQDEFGMLSQRTYPVLYSSDRIMPSHVLGVLTNEWGARLNTSK